MKVSGRLLTLLPLYKLYSAFWLDGGKLFIEKGRIPPINQGFAASDVEKAVENVKCFSLSFF